MADTRIPDVARDLRTEARLVLKMLRPKVTDEEYRLTARCFAKCIAALVVEIDPEGRWYE